MSDARGRQAARIAIGNGGWICYRSSDLAERLFVRVAEAPDGRLEVGDLFIPFEAPPSARQFQRLSEHLTALAAMVNERDAAQSVRERLMIPGPDLRTAASYFATTTWEHHWAAHMLHSQVAGSDVPKAPRRGLPRRPLPSEDPDLSLTAPTTKPHPDEFYRQVAEVYAAAAARSERPAAWIAEVNEIPVNTVRRWVAEARRRRHLPPGRKGRAG